MPVVSIVFVMTSIRSSASATVNVPAPRAFSSSVNHSASLGASGVNVSRLVSMHNGIGENLTSGHSLQQVQQPELDRRLVLRATGPVELGPVVDEPLVRLDERRRI